MRRCMEGLPASATAAPAIAAAASLTCLLRSLACCALPRRPYPHAVFEMSFFRKNPRPFFLLAKVGRLRAAGRRLASVPACLAEPLAERRCTGGLSGRCRRLFSAAASPPASTGALPRQLPAHPHALLHETAARQGPAAALLHPGGLWGSRRGVAGRRAGRRDFGQAEARCGASAAHGCFAQLEAARVCADLAAAVLRRPSPDPLCRTSTLLSTRRGCPLQPSWPLTATSILQ